MVTRLGFGSGEKAADASHSLVTGALIFRWVWLVWMLVLALASRNEFARPVLVISSLGVAAVWTIVLTMRRSSPATTLLLVDVIVCLWLVLASAFVVEEGEVVSGRPLFATGYPLSAPLLWGALRGPWAGALTAGILALGHLATRPLNGVSLDELTPGQVQNVTGAMLNYLVGGLAVGLVARLLWRSAAAVRSANEEVVREREHSARLAEREKLARTIHDSVLQALALVNKRGKELSAMDTVPREDVRRLAELAGRQGESLRNLIVRDPVVPPVGRASLRDALERTAAEVQGVHVSVSCVGELLLARHDVEELSAAVAQALANVADHSGAERAAVFAEDQEGDVLVTVRDDGSGFEYDEDKLRARSKVGILKSMKGRVEDLGGSFIITTAPGQGTEVEMRVPLREHA